MWILISCISDVGNEEFLDSTKIVEDRIQEVSDNGILGDDLFFWLDEDYECQAECKSRYFFSKYCRSSPLFKIIAQISWLYFE